MSTSTVAVSHPTLALTAREIEVMTWTAHGKTRGEISTILSISEETVKFHIEKSCRKLNAMNKTQAATIAVTLGLIVPFQINHAIVSHV